MDELKTKLKGMDRKCYWMFRKRLNNFPIELTRQANPKAIFSPDLMRYLDFDPKEGTFLLRYTLSEDGANY